MIDSLVVVGLSTLSLGTIHEADGPVERTFWLRNAGQTTVTLTQGYTSCGCTTITFDKAVAIASGDSTAVTLRFNPRGKGGEFHEVGTVEYGKKRVVMTLTGTCITSEETLLRQFPIRVNDSIRLSTDHFDLGIMRVGEKKERNVIVLHRNKNDRQERIPLQFAVDANTPKGLQHIAKKLKIGEQVLTVVLDVLVR